jgi:TonB family protein
MLRVLISSQPVRDGWFGSTAFSTIAHGALIALAVVSTSTPNVTSVHEERASAPERVTYVEPARFLLRRTTNAKTARKAAPARRAAPVIPDFSIVKSQVDENLSTVQIPDAAPPDLTAVMDAWVAAPDSTFGSADGDLSAKLFAQVNPQAPADGVYTEETVERSVKPRRGNPTPRYPGMLQDMGIEGDFVVKFVVDTTGAVMQDRIEFPSSMHRLFADAVRSALRRSRYFPAMFAGHAVPQLVIQEFRFTMGRGR